MKLIIRSREGDILAQFALKGGETVSVEYSQPLSYTPDKCTSTGIHIGDGLCSCCYSLIGDGDTMYYSKVDSCWHVRSGRFIPTLIKCAKNMLDKSGLYKIEKNENGIIFHKIGDNLL